jgi:formylglycine-generating enzyme required for sulfatase activity
MGRKKLGMLAVLIVASLGLVFAVRPSFPAIVDYIPGTKIRDCDQCPAMMIVGAGKFNMGSSVTELKSEDRERPQHDVTISRPFAIGIFEITFDEWDACVAALGCNGYIPDDEQWGRGERPVVHVNWNDANTYIEWLRKVTGEDYRLPTEAEWEFAARGGTTTAYSFGDDEDDLCSFANAADASLNAGADDGYLPLDCNDGFGEKTAPVGSFKPNAYGLYDVHGNVWEWVADCWNESYAGAPVDGSAWTQGDCDRRVLRSASWVDAKGGSLRSGHRGRIELAMRSNNLGFRIARTIKP